MHWQGPVAHFRKVPSSKRILSSLGLRAVAESNVVLCCSVSEMTWIPEPGFLEELLLSTPTRGQLESKQTSSAAGDYKVRQQEGLPGTGEQCLLG